MGGLVGIELPGELVSRAQVYAEEHGTTLSAIVMEYLSKLVFHPGSPPSSDPVALYSRGMLDRADAMRRLNLDNYAALVAALDAANLPLPPSCQDEGSRRGNSFLRLIGDD